MEKKNNNSKTIGVAILGFGREGRAVLRFLKNRNYCGSATCNSPDRGSCKLWILDKSGDIKLPRGARTQLGKSYLKNLSRFDIIYRSPGIPYTLPELQSAKRAGVKISSATELFFEHCPCPIVGITGTKGKSTTATLIYKILKMGGKDAYLAGNIGKPSLEILPELKKNSIAVLELSSFQLQALPHSPHIAVVVDIFPDHMDAHKNFTEYYEAKKNVARWQKKGDVVFYAANNEYATRLARSGKGKKIAVLATGSPREKSEKIAAAVARHLGIPEKTILKTISLFRGLPHRLEFVRHINTKQRTVNFYNDSASTNPHTAAAAIKSFTNPIILIAGGKDKKLDYEPLEAALKRSSVLTVIAYGENRNKIARAASDSSRKIIVCKNLKEAVQTAYAHALRLQRLERYNAITILLSPASASFDQFRDYKHRGEEFKRIVKSIKK